ncbi:hypothetical protein H6B31_09200 [Pseudoflavonifractor capillosus]|nr:hypothetical protein [Pseudoflavonifractor capillosus]
MLMKALGYFQYGSDFGSDWQLATVTQGNKIDLFEDVDSGVREAMTRNDLAQLVLNTLEAGTVEAESDGSISVGDITIVNNVKYNYVTSGRDYAKAIDDKITTNNDGDMTRGYVVELGEKLYQGELKKDDDTTDDLGRPATVWEYQGKEIGTFAETADHTFTAKVTSKALYDEVGKTAAEKYSWNVYLNGESIDYDGQDLIDNRNDNADDFVKEAGVLTDDATGNGVITEVYVDTTSGEESVTVAIIYSYAAEVLKVDEEDGTITLADLDNGPARTSDTYDATGFEEDQIVIYTYSEDTNEIQDVYAAELLEGEVTRVRSETEDGVAGNGDQFIVDGTTYKYNMTVSGSERLKAEAVSNDVVAYLDANGYVAYIDESAITYDYAYVLSMGNDDDRYGTDGTKGSTYYARLILTDGTMVKVETDATSKEAPGLKNQLVSYSVDKNDVYTLTPRGVAAATTTGNTNGEDLVENGKAGMTLNGDPRSANSNTVFILVDPDEDSFDDYDVSVYTGIKNVPDVKAGEETKTAVAMNNNGGVARVVYIEGGDVSGTDQVIFAIANSNAKIQKDSENGEYYEIDAVVDGAKDTLEVKAGSTSAVNALVKNIDNDAASISSTKSVVALKSMTENSDGFISSAKVYTEMDADGDGVLNAGDSLYVTGTKKAEDGTVGLGGTYYAYSDDVVVARWTLEDDAIEISRINSVKNDTNDKVVAIMDGRVVIGLFIIEVKGGEEEVKLTDDVSLSSVTVKGIEASQSGDTYTVNVPSEKNIDGVTQLVVKATDSNAKISDLKIDGGKYTVDNTAFGKTGERVITFTVTSSDGTKTADYTVKATIGAACKVTISATNALVKVDGKAISGTVTYDQGEELILTIVPADGMKIKDVKWDEGTAIPGFSGEYRVTVPSSESATLNVTAEAISES